MTEKTSAEWKEATDETTSAVDDNGWSEVQAEVQIVVEKEGDGWTGTLIELEPPNRNGITQAHFENAESLTGEWIGDSFVNAGRDLERKLSKVPAKSFVRVEWVSSMDTGQKTPMRVYKVQWR